MFFFDSIHPNGYEVIFHQSFHLYSSNHLWCWPSFCILTGYVSISGKCLFKSFVWFLVGLFVFWLSNCQSSLHVLAVNLLSDTWLLNTSSHSVHCLSTLLIVSFHAAWSLLILRILLPPKEKDCVVLLENERHMAIVPGDIKPDMWVRPS